MPSLIDGSQRGTSPYLVKSATASALGSTALWTPAAGKRVQLAKLCIHVTANASIAAGGILTIALLDAAASLGLSFACFVPAAAATTVPFDSGWMDLDLGPVEAAANDVLNINLSAALATGVVSVVAVGWEV